MLVILSLPRFIEVTLLNKEISTDIVFFGLNAKQGVTLSLNRAQFRIDNFAFIFPPNGH